MPRLSSANVASDILLLVFDRPLESTEIPASTAFALTGTEATVVSLTISDRTAALTLSSSVVEGETIALSYTAPDSKPLRRAGGAQEVADISAFAVTNLTVNAPAPTSLTVNGDTLSILFDADLDSNSSVSTSAFSAKVDGSDSSFSELTIATRTVTLKLAAAVSDGASVSLTFAPSSDAPLNGQNGLAVAAFSDVAVVNQTDDAPSLVSASATGSGTQITLRFSEPLSAAASSTPAATTFTLSGTAAQVSSVSMSGREVVLAVSPALHETDSASIGYTQPTDQGSPRLRDTDQGSLAVADWSGAAIDNQVDTVPRVVSGEVNGTAIRIEFDQDLDLTKQPAASGFSLSPSRSMSSVSLTNSGSSSRGLLELTLAKAVREGDTVTLSFSPDGDSQIVDPEGNAASIQDLALTNRTDTPTTATRAIGNGGAIRITFDQSLNEEVVPAASSFTVSVPAATIQTVAIKGAVVTLTISPALTDGDALTVSYSPPNVDALVDTTGTALAAFSLAVTNETDDVPRLTSVIAEGDGGSLSLRFSETLREDTAGTPSASSFTLTGTKAAATEVSVSGSAVTLTLSPTLHETDAGKLSYAPPKDPTAARLRDLDQGKLQVEAWTERAIDNQVDTSPRVLSAQINGDRVELRFDQDLDLDTQPDASGFSLVPSRSVSSVSLANDSETTRGVLVLRLSASVREGVSVTLTFTPSGDSGIVDPEGNAATIAKLSLTNETETPTNATSATANGSTLTLTFDQPLDETADVDIAQFTLSGTTAVPTSLEMSGSTVSVQVSPDFRESELATVAYAPARTGNLIDQTGTAVPAFTLAITNETDTAPAPQRATVSGAGITIFFDQTLNESVYPGISAFSVTVAGVERDVTAVKVSGVQVVLRLSSVARRGEVVTATYTQDSDYGLRDLSENLTASFSAFEAEHAGPPLPISATANGRELAIAFDSALDQEAIPPTSSFVIDDATPPLTVALSSQLVSLTLDSALIEDADVRIRHRPADDGNTRLRGANSLHVLGFDSDDARHRLSVANQTDTPPVLIEASAALKSVQLVFDQTLDLARQPSTSEFSTSSAAHQVTAASLENIDGQGVVKLTVSPALAEDEELSLTYAPTTASTRMADPEGNSVSISAIELENHTDTAPVPLSGTVNGTAIKLDFDQSLYLETRAIPTDHFTISGIRAAVSVDAIALSNDASGGAGRLQITLDTAVHELDTVSLDYDPSYGSALIRDDDPGQNRAQIDQYQLSNLTDTAPVFASAVADGEAVTVTFDQPLSTAHIPETAAFDLGSGTPAVDSVTIAGAAATLSLEQSVVEDANLSLTYTVPDTNSLRDGSGNLVAGFSASIENETDYAPFPVAAASNETGTEITVVFDQDLNPGKKPPNDRFALSGGAVVDNQEIVGSVLTLTLTNDRPLREGEAVTLAYNPPKTDSLQDDDLPNLVASFTIAVENRTDVAPIAEHAWIQAQTLTIQFDQALDEQAVPPPSCEWVKENEPAELYDAICAPDGIAEPAVWFEVFAGEAGIALTQVEIESSAVILTLAGQASSTEVITTSYTRPHVPERPEWELRDTSESHNRVRQFEAFSVANRIAAVPVSAAVDTSNRRQINMTFDAALASGSAPSLGAFVVYAGVVELALQSAAVDDSSLTLLLNRPIPECVGVRLVYRGDQTQPWLDGKGYAVVSFEIRVSNLIAAAAGLSCLRAEGKKLLLDFETPPASVTKKNWNAAVGGEEGTVASVSIDEGRVALTPRSRRLFG